MDEPDLDFVALLETQAQSRKIFRPSFMTRNLSGESVRAEQDATDKYEDSNSKYPATPLKTNRHHHYASVIRMLVLTGIVSFVGLVMSNPISAGIALVVCFTTAGFFSGILWNDFKSSAKKTPLPRKASTVLEKAKTQPLPTFTACLPVF